MLEFGSKAVINYRDLSKKIFTHASEWHSYDMWEMNDPSRTGKEAEIAAELQQKFYEHYDGEHFQADGIRAFQCITFKIPAKMAERVAAAVRQQIASTSDFHLRGEGSNAESLQEYAEKKQVRYQSQDVDGKNIMIYEMHAMTPPKEPEFTYISLLIHSEMRALIAADLLQQEVSRGW